MKIMELASTTLVVMFVVFTHASPAECAPLPDFSDSVGEWDIEGLVVGKGNTIVCKMQRDDENGSPFAEVFMMSAGSNGVDTADTYVTMTNFAEGSSPRVAIYFDGKKTMELMGKVHQGFLSVDLNALDISKLAQIADLYKNSKSLTEWASLDGQQNEKTIVDLTDAYDAFDKRGECAKAVLDLGMARLKTGN